MLKSLMGIVFANKYCNFAAFPRFHSFLSYFPLNLPSYVMNCTRLSIFMLKKSLSFIWKGRVTTVCCKYALKKLVYFWQLQFCTSLFDICYLFNKWHDSAVFANLKFMFILVTLDYKSLLLLIRRILEDQGEGDDDHWEPLGGKGFEVGFCVFCTALRVSENHFLSIYK